MKFHFTPSALKNIMCALAPIVLSACGNILGPNSNATSTYTDSKAATAQSAVALVETISSNSETEPAKSERDPTPSSTPAPTATPAACLYNHKSRPGPCTGKAANALAVTWANCTSRNGDIIAGGYIDSFHNAASGAADPTSCSESSLLTGFTKF